MNPREPLIHGISSMGRLLPDLDGKSLVISKAEGCHLWDTNGNKYIDTLMGFGSIMLGHSHPSVVKALAEQLKLATLPGFKNDVEPLAAEVLVGTTGQLNKAVFVNSGSEAVRLAIRIAMAKTGRTKFLKLKEGYNGWLLDWNGSNDRVVEISVNDSESLKKKLATRQFAALIIEPLLANKGCIELSEEFITTVTTATKESNTLFIADEVLTGFRQHSGLTCTQLGLEPDIATLGKAIGNGIPISAVVGKEEIMEVVEKGVLSTAGTYNGNPLSATAVLATLSELRNLDYLQPISFGEGLRRQIDDTKLSSGTKLSTSGHSTVFSVWFNESPPTNGREAVDKANHQMSRELHLFARKRGVLLSPDPYGRMFISFAHSKEDLRDIGVVIEEFAGQH